MPNVSHECADIKLTNSPFGIDFRSPLWGRAGWGLELAPRGPGDAGKALGDGPELSPASRLDPVGQHHVGHLVDLRDPYFRNPPVGGQGLGGLAADQVGTMAVDLQADVQLRQGPQD